MLVYSTNKEFFAQQTAAEEKIDTPAPSKQKLIVRIDRRQRAGKQVSLIEGFVGTQEDLAALARTLKTRCGTGGTAKDGEITIQGDFRDKLVGILTEMGYKARRGN